jgi:two-component system chemotaxis response regulator CheB
MTAPAPIRVLVVDDSAFARKVLREALSQDPRLTVVGIARDGFEALERINELKPDVVTLDLVMPNLDGLGFMQALPALGAPSVVLVTTSDSTSELAVAALAAGAIDFVHKPTALATERLFELSDELRTKVVAAAAARPQPSVRAVAPSLPAPGRAAMVRAVVIGTSTGGPQALARLIPALPKYLPVPVLVALHSPAGYTDALARRLDESSGLTVVEAGEVDIELRAGLVVLARGGEHLIVASSGGNLVARFDRSLRNAAFVPSVNHLFLSAARELGRSTLGVVLTGMGDDGMEGSREIRRQGGEVLVESAGSCVVHGMPRAVRDAGLATEEAPLHAMAERIVARL